MMRDVFTFIVGGKAGEGVKKSGLVASSMLADLDRNLFQMDDYQSLIRGGHNFAVVSSSADALTSHHLLAQLIVCLDERSYHLHRHELAEGGVLVYNSDVMSAEDGIGLPMTSEARPYPRPDLRVGVASITVLAVALGHDMAYIEKVIEREYKRDLEHNVAYASRIFELAAPTLAGRFPLARGHAQGKALYGSEAISLGAIAGGLDLYMAYPMTPSSPILHYLAAEGPKNGVHALHLESEVSVANMAVGSAFAGARTAVGTSGGGFALMTEAFSLAGIMEAPVLFILASRPGPSTGVPTYTEQADLKFAIGAGHGDFPRIVASPGTVEESFYLTADLLDLAWRFQSPTILLTEKHLTESCMNATPDAARAAWAQGEMYQGHEGDYKRYLCTESGVSPLLHPPSSEVIKWSSYEHDEVGITTDEPGPIAAMHDKRQRKHESIVEHLRGIRTVSVFGDGGPVIFTYGSSTMSVLEALRTGGIQATVVQPIYLEPFPVWEVERYRGSNPIVVEQSVSGQFANLIREQTGITSDRHIRRYDGRPFEPSELAQQIKDLI